MGLTPVVRNQEPYSTRMTGRYPFGFARGRRQALLLVLLVATYLNLGVTVGGSYVSGLLLIPLGLALLSIHLMGPDRKKVGRATALFFIAGLSWALTIPFSPDPSGFFLEHVKSLALLVASILTAYGIYAEISRHSPRKLESSAIAIFLFLLILGLLEVFTPFSDLSNSVRSFIFGDAFLYSSDIRDLQIAGGVRPKVFTQEPSHYAKALAVSLACAVILSRHRSRYVLGGMGWILSIGVAGSPTLLLAPGIIALEMAYRSPTNYSSQFLKILRILVVFIPIFILANLQQVASYLPFERTQQIAVGSDGSALTRSVAPPMIAAETIRQYPLAGAGIGGRELVDDIVYRVYSQFPGYHLRRLDDNLGYAGWGNAFFEIPVYGGFVFTILLMALLLHSFKRLHFSRLLGFGCFFLIFNFDSGFVSPRVWCYFMVVMAICAVRFRRDQIHQAVLK